MRKMSEKVYLNLFILCVILSQGIVGSFVKDDTGESSNVLVREKRVINRNPGGNIPVAEGEIPYVVNIKEHKRSECAGTILTHRTVITASRCVLFHVSAYKVYSGSIFLNKGLPHDVTGKKIHSDQQSRGLTSVTGIALIFVSPGFVFNEHTKRINLHTGLVLPGMHATVSGWGSYMRKAPKESRYRTMLRSITVPIINHKTCVNSYEGFFQIGDDKICTFDEHKQCGVADIGVPLVIDNELAAVHVGAIETLERRGCHLKPDVYALLQHHEYSNWIRSNIVH